MRLWPLAIAGLLSSAASAEDVRLTPLIDARLRWESIEQADVPRDADAVTIRVRSGVKADAGVLQALVESEATIAIVQRYNSGTNGRTLYPLVVDPQNIELNRAQLRYEAHGVALTGGRQRLELGDQRFVGSAPFRQNEQTFDAARLQVGDAKALFADITYAWSVRTVNGIDGRGARQQAVSGGNVFAILGAKTPFGTATAFSYFVNQDEVAVQGFRLSSGTHGVRLAGAMPIRSAHKIAYVASWARQSDWHRNPNRYAADYWLLEATGSAGRLALTVGQEVLGADDGRALTSVQTPLASLFKFQGWADKFTTTPPNGLRDLYGTAGLSWKKTSVFDGAGLSATYHRFRSDRLSQHYGTEIDILATMKRGHTMLSARFAHYKADGFATDTDKVWLQADWSL
jgi:hypothetical protein